MKSFKTIIRIAFYSAFCGISYFGHSQIDSINSAKLDEILISLQELRTDPKNTTEYSQLKSQYDIVLNERDRCKSDKTTLENSLTQNTHNNDGLLVALVKCRTTSTQRDAVRNWARLQNITLKPAVKFSLDISDKLDEIDKKFTIAPDAGVLQKLSIELNNLKQYSVDSNLESQMRQEVSIYIQHIQGYFKALKEFQTVIGEITPSYIQSSVTDVVMVYKCDITYYPFLKNAFYFAANYPDSSKYISNFIWFRDNDMMIPPY